MQSCWLSLKVSVLGSREWWRRTHDLTLNHYHHHLPRRLQRVHQRWHKIVLVFWVESLQPYGVWSENWILSAWDLYTLTRLLDFRCQKQPTDAVTRRSSYCIIHIVVYTPIEWKKHLPSAFPLGSSAETTSKHCIGGNGLFRSLWDEGCTHKWEQAILACSLVLTLHLLNIESSHSSLYLSLYLSLYFHTTYHATYHSIFHSTFHFRLYFKLKHRDIILSTNSPLANRVALV